MNEESHEILRDYGTELKLLIVFLLEVLVLAEHR